MIKKTDSDLYRICLFMAKDLNILTERGKKRKILRNVNGRDLIKPAKGIQIENV